MLDVADDPDNLPRAALVYRVWVVTQQNLLPDRVFVRKEAMRKRFVHDNRPRRGLCIVIIKIAPLFQRNLEGAEKARNDFVVAGTRPLVRRRFRVSQDREGVPLGEPCRKTGDGTNGCDACRAGISPKMNAVKREIPSVKSSTRASIAMLSALGKSPTSARKI